MKISRVLLAGGIVSATLFVLVGLWAYRAAAQQKQDDRESLRSAWEQGYWAGATNGLEAARIEFVKAHNRHGPLDGEEMWPVFVSGLTNNPYQR